jgi:hypothetical protein
MHVHMCCVCEMCLYIERSTCFEVIYLCIVLPFAHACSPALSTTKESTYIPRKKLLHSRIVTVSVNLAWRSLCYAHASYLAWLCRVAIQLCVSGQGLGFRVSHASRHSRMAYPVYMHSRMAYPVYEAPEYLYFCALSFFIFETQEPCSGSRFAKKKFSPSWPGEMSSKDINLCLGKCLANKHKGLRFFAEKQSLLTKFS